MKSHGFVVQRLQPCVLITSIIFYVDWIVIFHVGLKQIVNLVFIFQKYNKGISIQNSNS